MKNARREEVLLNELAPPLSHYVHAVHHDGLLFISGLVGLDADMTVVGDDVTTQTDRILQDMGRILARFDADLSAVLRVTVYVTQIEDRAAINEVRKRHFGAARPASTLVEVSALVMPELKVEIEAIAAI